MDNVCEQFDFLRQEGWEVEFCENAQDVPETQAVARQKSWVNGRDMRFVKLDGLPDAPIVGRPKLRKDIEKCIEESPACAGEDAQRQFSRTPVEPMLCNGWPLNKPEIPRKPEDADFEWYNTGSGGTWIPSWHPNQW